MIEDGSVVHVISDTNFNNYLKKECPDDKLFLIDFWAEWCSPCKMFAPIFDEVAIEYNTRVNFGKCDVDKNPLIIKKYNIRSIPTLLLFRNYMVVGTKLGIIPKKELHEFLNINLL